MPQKKRAIRFSDLSTALLFHPEVGKFTREREGGFRDREEFKVLIKVAENPRTFSQLEKKSFELFTQVYARQPDDVLDFMTIIRKILKKWETTQAGAVIKSCCKRRSIQVDKRRVVEDEEGKFATVIIRSLFDDSEKRISVIGFHPEKVNALLTPTFKAWETLLDKELAILLRVSAESVKKARQELARIDMEIAYWEHPAVVKFYQDGVVTQEYGRVWSEYSKRKK
jgi:hypothetical protein